MTDEQVEKIIKSNMMLQMNLAGIRADFEEASQRTWIGLTDEEASEIGQQANRFDWLTDYSEAIDFVIEVTTAKLKKKNTYE